ncbi:hypothetical protein ACN47E_001981 [Coniothyrium glycines]
MVSTEASNAHFSISNLISRFRSKKRSTKPNHNINGQSNLQYEDRLALVAAPLPLVLPEHQKTLSTLGWTTLTFPDYTSTIQPELTVAHPTTEYDAPSKLGPHPLQQAYEDLFVASQAFFDQSDQEKSQWKHKLGSEEGWSKIPGEKEFITLRTLEYCPDILRDPAKRYWDLMGAHLSNTLGRISTSLGLDAGEEEGLRRFVGPCKTMQAKNDDKTATMLRLFRYEGWDAKEVAEPHADLGLLSVVVGNVPGLEVWDGFTWFACEKEVENAGKKGASLLAGRQLERFSNGRYPAGGHRVVSYGLPNPLQSPTRTPPASMTVEKNYRFSIVFVLRAHEPIIINSDDLETKITGKWMEPLRGVTAGLNYEEIRGKHYNINIGMKERERQRQKIKTVKSRNLPSSG